ncbi:MAG: c-type cytochrome [Steroidobacter sp.]
MKLRLTVLLGLGLALSMATAWADGDANRGKTLAYTCHGCHGIPNYKNAAPTYSVPKLGGQRAEYMVEALKEYASGDRVHPTMHAQSASNSEQDRADMVAFFQGSNAANPNQQVVGTPPAIVSNLCVACHGTNGVGISPIYPTLAGQHADYIAQALRDYKSGKRKNAIMSAQAANVKDEDIAAIAAFFSKQKALCSTDEIRDNAGKCK